MFIFELDGLVIEVVWEWFVMVDVEGFFLLVWMWLLKFECLFVFENGNVCVLDNFCVGMVFFLGFGIDIGRLVLLDKWVLDLIGCEMMLVLDFIFEFFVIFCVEFLLFLVLLLRFDFIEVEISDRLEMIVDVEWILVSLKVGFFFLVGFFEFERRI